MEVNFNRGHREVLQNIGILKPGESKITIDDLANKTIETGNIKPVMDMLEQELKNRHQDLVFVDDKLERAKRESTEIHDEDSLLKVENRVSQIEDILQTSRVQASVITDSAIAIKDRVQSEEELKIIAEHLGRMIETRAKMVDIFIKKGDLMIEDLEGIYSVVNTWRNKFQASEE